MIAIIFLSVLTGTYLVGCGDGQESIKIEGSDTMLNLTTKWAQAFKEKHGNIKVQVSGGGSGKGIKALINKSVDFSMASRKMKEKEVEACKKVNIEPVEHIVAYDGLAIVVHKDNPLDEISFATLKKIYSDRGITNWNQVGGPDMKLVVFGRDSSSGTFVYFKEKVIGKKETDQYRDDMKRTQGNAQILDQVKTTRGGIGYVGLGYVEGQRGSVKVLKVRKKASDTALAPEHRDYPLCRPLHFYTNGEPTGNIKAFIDFALSEEGQKIVEEEGFIPKKKREG